MTDLYVFAAVVVAMALTLLIALWLAPEGWQDREGFHVGTRAGSLHIWSDNR